MEFYKQALKIWKKIAPSDIFNKSDYQIELHKKVFSLVQAGASYYFIFNVNKGEFEFISEEVYQVLGFSAQSLTALSFLNNIHPEDRPYFIAFEDQLNQFFRSLEVAQIPSYKIQYDFRVRSASGNYRQILHQMVIIHYDDDKNLLRSLGIHTDITHIKLGGKPKLSFIDLEGKSSYYDVQAGELIMLPSNEIFSKREKEVLRLIISGHNSTEIAGLLYISINTVHTHRKNIMHKSGCKSVADLVSRTIRESWV